MNNSVDLVLSKKKKKKKKKCGSGPFSFCWLVWENVLGLHNQIFHFGLINKNIYKIRNK